MKAFKYNRDAVTCLSVCEDFSGGAASADLSLPCAFPVPSSHSQTTKLSLSIDVSISWEGETGDKPSGLGYRQQVEPKALVTWGPFLWDPTPGGIGQTNENLPKHKLLLK